MLKAVRLDMPDGSGWHSHRQQQWVSAGRGFVSIETEAAQWFALPGQALLVASDVPHDLKWFGAESVVSLYLTPDAIELPRNVDCRRSLVSPLMSAAVGALADDGSKDSDRTERRVEHLSAIALDEMTSDSNLDAFFLPNPISRRLRTVCLRLRERPSDSSDLDTCADLAGMSRRTFTRKFRQETGLAFNEWHRRMCAVHAIKCKMRGLKSKEICAACGYNNVKYMYSDFIKSVGISFRVL